MNPLALMASTGLASGAAPRVYSDDLFGSFTYTGTRAVQTIANGIDLTADGGMIWTKIRDTPTAGSPNHALYDSVRGFSSVMGLLESNTNSAAKIVGNSSAITPLSNGYSVDTDSAWAHINYELLRYVSWTFRRAQKFFDVITWTGDGAASRSIPHALGATPGMVLCKAVNAAGEWYVGHGDFLTNSYVTLNGTAAAVAATPQPVGFDASSITVQQSAAPYLLNNSGTIYVAYLFGDDTSTYGNIRCGSYVGNGSSNGPMVDTGWEPQFILVKNISAASNWVMLDELRGLSTYAASAKISANLSAIESLTLLAAANSSGFQPKATVADINTNGNTYIFMAVRRQNKPPTSADTVFTPLARTGTAAASTLNTSILTDLLLSRARSSAVAMLWWDRLRGALFSLSSASTAAQVSTASSVTAFDAPGGVKVSTATPNNAVAQATYALRRAPQFFDQVIYNGSGADQSVRHALSIAPELAIIKLIGAVDAWFVAYPGAAASSSQMTLNTTAAAAAPTTSSFTVTDANIVLPGASSAVNGSGKAFAAYLFGTCAGVSKCGTYTASGANGQVIDCGFSAGARFVMIKRIDGAGDWYVWDSARGISSGNDAHLSMNTTVAEVSDDSIDPDASGFAINQVAGTNINVTGGQYMFLAIA